MNVLILSLLALFAGPLLYHWMQGGGLVARTLDRVIVAVLVLLVVLLLVPEAVAGLGFYALLLMVAGYLAPGLLESSLKGAAHTLHLISLVVALVGLTLHAMLDGAGLAGSELQQSASLAAAIILHRLGVGLVIWLMVQPVFGRNAALLVLLMVSLTTVLGFGLSESLLPLAGRDGVLIVQTLIIGTIIHSLVHRGHLEAGHNHE